MKIRALVIIIFYNRYMCWPFQQLSQLLCNFFVIPFKIYCLLYSVLLHINGRFSFICRTLLVFLHEVGEFLPYDLRLVDSWNLENSTQTKPLQVESLGNNHFSQLVTWQFWQIQMPAQMPAPNVNCKYNLKLLLEADVLLLTSILC